MAHTRPCTPMHAQVRDCQLLNVTGTGAGAIDDERKQLLARKEVLAKVRAQAPTAHGPGPGQGVWGLGFDSQRPGWMENGGGGLRFRVHGSCD